MIFNELAQDMADTIGRFVSQNGVKAADTRSSLPQPEQDRGNRPPPYKPPVQQRRKVV